MPCCTETVQKGSSGIPKLKCHDDWTKSACQESNQEQSMSSLKISNWSFTLINKFHKTDKRVRAC